MRSFSGMQSFYFSIPAIAATRQDRAPQTCGQRASTVKVTEEQRCRSKRTGVVLG